MKFVIKPLKEPYPYSKIAELLEKTYFQEYLNAGAILWDEKYTKFYFDAVVFSEESRKYIFGAFKGKRLIGTLFGHRETIMLDNELRLETVNLGLLAVDPKFRRQGIAKALLSKLIKKAKKENIDFLMAFPEQGRFGDKLLKNHFDFKSYGKNKHLLKLMEDQGLYVLSEYYKVNPILVKLASLYAKVPQLGEPDGKLRIGKETDYPKIIDLINSYKSRVPLSTIYSLEGHRKHYKEINLLNSIFGDPCNYYSWVLEKNDEIIAHINNRIEMVTFEPEEGKYIKMPVSLLTSVAFHEDLEKDEKVKFINCILRKTRTNFPNVFASQITTCQHEMKAFRKLKFISDRSYYILCMRPLTKRGEEINRYKKYKDFFLDYYR